MFPAPLGTPLDASMARALDMPCTPDILVVPSELAPFAKLLPLPPSRLGAGDGTADAAATVVCVNPGKLTKGTSGGTFAHVTVRPHPEALRVLDGNPAATNGAIPHHVALRCSVQVKKV
jgi:DNA polymerase alpha subunit B